VSPPHDLGSAKCIHGKDAQTCFLTECQARRVAGVRRANGARSTLPTANGAPTPAAGEARAPTVNRRAKTRAVSDSPAFETPPPPKLAKLTKPEKLSAALVAALSRLDIRRMADGLTCLVGGKALRVDSRGFYALVRRELGDDEVTDKRILRALDLIDPSKLPLYKPPRVVAPAPDPDEAWRDRLLLSEPERDGRVHVLPTLPNLVTILRFHIRWRGVMGWDAFGERIVSTAPPPWDPAAAPQKNAAGEWRETDLARTVDWLARNEQLRVSTKLVAEAAAVVAESNERHPVREYLGRLKWDGTERLPTWLATYAGAADTEYTRAIGRRWMISAVARVMRPGCQVDCVLVAESRDQGTGKSNMFRTLVPDVSLYSETGVSIGDKDSYQCLHGVWIFLFDELDSLKRGDVTKVKNFISAMKDHYRPSYGRVARDFLRQNVFAGSTNETDYLIDKTGNRRIWPFRVVGVIDIAAIARDRDQLWAEALHRFKVGEKWHVDTPELRALCEAEQAERVHADPWEPIVAAWLADPDHEVEPETDNGMRQHREPFRIHDAGPTTAEVLQHGVRMRLDAISPAASSRCALVLRTLGYTVLTRPDDGGARPRRYARPTPSTHTPEGMDE
jgi:predicted P-loop ATPase